ncbi:MAG: hsp70 nucleotide exchange factor fes1 [Alectoria fallacina]|uniref:quinol--cytochrome-c reductase n=1 Tax=Alectoria fallacina TaxID=1903189 RepID=A0A8H3J6S7_9LECA|nr:MAG: hsp70 nucleotide exchange factor fes1 [Alectoria fallacina]
MPPLPAARSNLLRLCPRQHVPSTINPSFLAATQQRRCKADIVERHSGEYEQTPRFESPFKNREENPTTKIPSFANYMSKKGETSNKTFQYFMVGGMGLLAAAGAKATVQDFLVNMSASADVLAQAKVEIDLAAIPEGKNVIIKWRGKPVFIRHRTADEIKEAEDTKWETLRDPQPDSDRVKKPEWLIMLGTLPPFPISLPSSTFLPFPLDRSKQPSSNLTTKILMTGVCTHLGCVPIGESGDFGGWFCPCHGSHYDISGRARKGPAPLNLAVPEYEFPEDEKVIIG